MFEIENSNIEFITFNLKTKPLITRFWLVLSKNGDFREFRAMIIKLREMLRQIELKDADGNPVSFSASWVTFNRATKTGGEVRSAQNITILSRVKGASGQNSSGQKVSKTTKNPNHKTNATRNFHLVDSDEIKKVNIFLITEFNGQKVMQ